MTLKGPVAAGLLAMALAVGGMGAAALAQTAPGAPATAPAATAGSTTRAKRPPLAEVLSRKKVDLDFELVSPSDVLEYLGKSYDAQVENAFRKQLTDRLTIKRTNVDAMEALNLLNLGIQSMGYSVVPTVRTNDGTPQVVLTVVQIKDSAGKQAPVFTGMDPAKIPEGNELRTQIITVKFMDLEKARDLIIAPLSQDASLNIDPDNKTLIVTDTSTHIRSLVNILQVLDKPPATGGK